MKRTLSGLLLVGMLGLIQYFIAGGHAQSGQLDVLIRGGSVIDGTGGAAREADVGIRGDRIVLVGDAAKEGRSAKRVIEAKGLIIAPGFIDPHTHAADDLGTMAGRSNQNFLFQGVTTVVTGNDGGGPLPIGTTLRRWEELGIGTNAILYVGHGTVRQRVMGMSDAAPGVAELEKMKSLVRDGMREGAFGLSTGLYYAPGSYAKTGEVIALARVAAELGGVYDTHMRDESSYNIGVLESIRETIEIGRQARLPVHISHIKMLGVDVWGRSGEAIGLINEARREGVEVTANQYPYTASGTSLTAALVPRWAEVGGTQELLKRIDDASIRPRLISEMEVNLKRRGGAGSLLIARTRDRALIGKRLDEIARQRGRSAIETALDIIRDGGAGVASFNMDEKDIENFMRQPWVMTGSDGSSGHPRKYGTYPRKIRDYVLTRKVISLPRMIEASSGQVATALRIPERGRIARGWFADVIVFDAKTIAENATYEQPEILSTGLRYVLVNGRVAIDNGQYTGALAGRSLRKQ
ncbi:MAG: N-acyl-D-amino-acid deacylase family protein [Blastocatellia bacterium]|jgi:N-acyl-D-amino-acid deacylase